MANKELNISKVLTYTVVGIVGLVGIGWAVNKIRKMSLGAKLKAEQSDALAEQTKSIDAIKLTKPETDYKNASNRLYEVMNGAGTQDSSILNIIVPIVKNRHDWNKLCSEFGIQKANSWYSSFSGTLSTWLQSELTQGNIDKLTKYLNNMGASF